MGSEHTNRNVHSRAVKRNSSIEEFGVSGAAKSSSSF